MVNGNCIYIALS